MSRNRKKTKPQPAQTDAKAQDAVAESANSTLGDSAASASNKEYGGNDLDWYSRYANLLILAANVPYPYKPGMQVPLIDTQYSSRYNNPTVPGIITIEWIPAVGKAQTHSDPINLASEQLYARIRSAYSGTLRVERPDIMVYIIAITGMNSFITVWKRVGRCLKGWNPDNYLIPRKVVDALLTGTNAPADVFDCLLAAKDVLESRIETMSRMVNRYMLPDLFNVMKRHVWLNDNLFTDAPTAAAQIYAFVQTSFPIFDELQVTDAASSATASGISWNGFQFTAVATPDKFMRGASYCDQIFEFFDGMFNQLASWDESKTINGYLRRAYEGETQFLNEPFSCDEDIKLFYNAEVLMQIENARILPGSYVLGEELQLRQNLADNCLQIDYSYTVDQSDALTLKQLALAAAVNPTVNVHVENPGVPETVIATRMQTSIDMLQYDSSASKAVVSPILATELVCGMMLTTMEYTVPIYSVYPYDEAPANAYFDQFSQHPMIFEEVNPLPSSTDTVATIVPHGDVDNLTVMSKFQMKEIMRVCVESEYNTFG